MGEVLLADIERVRTIINQGIIESSILKNINNKYVADLKRKISDNFTLDRGKVDINATKIIERQRIKLKNSFRPIRLVIFR